MRLENPDVFLLEVIYLDERRASSAHEELSEELGRSESSESSDDATAPSIGLPGLPAVAIPIESLCPESDQILPAFLYIFII